MGEFVTNTFDHLAAVSNIDVMCHTISNNNTNKPYGLLLTPRLVAATTMYPM